MHIYVFDHFLSDKKYEKVVAKIETRITDLGLSGKNCRVGPLKSLRSIVREELRTKLKTIIAVGNNATLNAVINSFDEEHVATVGLIPVGPDNSIAESLGIPFEDAACNTLSARLIEQLDLGALNDTYFLTHATIPAKGTIIEVDERYTVEPIGTGTVTIVNLDVTTTTSVSNPQDGLLETFIEVTQKGFLSKKTADRSFLRSNQLIINNVSNQTFTLDDAVAVKPPVQVSVAPRRLQMIVGRERRF